MRTALNTVSRRYRRWACGPIERDVVSLYRLM
jgi:hypothetical protein